MYRLQYSKLAQKHLLLLWQHKSLFENIAKILSRMKENPFYPEPNFKKLKGTDLYSRRLNIQHRVVYEVNELQKIIYVHRVWGHYGD